MLFLNKCLDTFVIIHIFLQNLIRYSYLFRTPPGSALSSNTSLSEEMELSKQRHRHDAIIKARKKNMIAKSQLQDKIHRINRNHNLQFKQLTKQKRLLEEELGKTTSSNVSHLPSITPNVTLTTSETSLYTDTPCSSCLFGITKTFRCQNFPCCLPQTYHTIGAQNSPMSYSKLSNYHELQGRSRDVRPPTSKRIRTIRSDSSEPNRSPRKSVDDKIRGLGYLIREMREEHEKHKPINWSTNYGEPFPKRLLLKPIVKMSS